MAGCVDKIGIALEAPGSLPWLLLRSGAGVLGSASSYGEEEDGYREGLEFVKYERQPYLAKM